MFGTARLMVVLLLEMERREILEPRQQSRTLITKRNCQGLDGHARYSKENAIDDVVRRLQERRYYVSMGKWTPRLYYVHRTSHIHMLSAFPLNVYEELHSKGAKKEDPFDLCYPHGERPKKVNFCDHKFCQSQPKPSPRTRRPLGRYHEMWICVKSELERRRRYVVAPKVLSRSNIDWGL